MLNERSRLAEISAMPAMKRSWRCTELEWGNAPWRVRFASAERSSDVSSPRLASRNALKALGSEHVAKASWPRICPTSASAGHRVLTMAHASFVRSKSAAILAHEPYSDV